jgi:hypothetical protein
MQDHHLFEYAAIRVVPRVEREEFINVGVILYCPKLKYLKAVYALNQARINSFTQSLDLDELHGHLCMFEHICTGNVQGGPIAALDAPSRFRWLTATRSTVVQCSKVHPGLCTDAEATLMRLFAQLVL